jgi:hypothetical protein
MKMTTNAMTLKRLRRDLYTAETVEKWIDYIKQRRDLYRLFDTLAMKKGQGIIGIQSTTTLQLTDHRKKIRANPILPIWLESGGRCQLWGWEKVPKGARVYWIPRIQEVSILDGVVIFTDVLADEAKN